MRCDPIQKKGMPSFFVLALFGVSPNVESTCRVAHACAHGHERLVVPAAAPARRRFFGPPSSTLV